jgi:hypothetical protein
MSRVNLVYLRFVILALASSLGITGWTILREPMPKVTKRNCERIREGMTKQEVVAILGYADNGFFPFGFTSVGTGEAQSFEDYRNTGRLPPWEADRVGLTVYYTRDHRVAETDLWIRKRTWKDRLTQWLPW